MKTFRLIISSPDGNLFDGETFMLSLRGAAGDLAVLADHAAFTTVVKAGEVKVEFPDETYRLAKTDGGILTVSSNEVTLLSPGFTWNDRE